MSLIFIDVEADGPVPGLGVMTEFGAVEYKTREEFYGILWKANPAIENPAMSKLDHSVLQKSDAERVQVFLDFESWLYKFDRRPVAVSDNICYDGMWMLHGFWHHIGRCPLGHSGRRISDYYAGLTGNFYNTQKWKHLRQTKHSHKANEDARGNVEAFYRLQHGER